MRTAIAGTLLNRRFRIEERIADGGFGVLYRGTDVERGAPVAIKVLALDEEGEQQRFEREGALLSRVAHRNVAQFIAHGREEDGEQWLVMEWIEGVELRQRLKSDGPLSIGQSIVMIERLADTLCTVHRAGIVHRDIKPGNIILRDGSPADPVLIDFGIATMPAMPPLTRPGMLIGTPAYMAPEQIMPLGPIDARADLFSLGCVWFESLVGHAPFSAEHVVAVLAKVMITEMPSLESAGVRASTSLEDLLRAMLAREREHRVPSAADLLTALQQLREHPSNLPPSNTGTRAALTRTELRVRSVLVAASPTAADDRTLRAPDLAAIDRGMAAVRREAQRQRVRLFEFIDRSWIAIIDEDGRDARDSAAALARVGLVARSTLGAVPVAIATGKARFNSERAPFGPVIDRAAAMLTQPLIARTLYTDEATAALVDATLWVEERAPHHLVRAEGSRVERMVLGRHTPFVGRERELDALVRELSSALDGGECACALLVGDSGVGKSRLLSELTRRVGERWPGARSLTVRCSSNARSAALSLAATIVRALIAAPNESEPPAERVRELVERHRGLSRADALERAEFLEALAGYPDDPSARSAPMRAARADTALMHEQMSSAFVATIVSECERAPLVLVLDDAHWIDDASLALLSDALAACVEARFALVVSAMPEGRERLSSALSRSRALTITVGPLPRAACVTLCQSAIDADEATINAIVQRSAGNVFFLEELVRAYAHSKDRVTLPDSVAAMVSARFERLDERTRRVLRAASVMGRSFWSGAVHALTGSVSDSALDALSREELIAPRAPSSLRGEREFVFRNAILRDVAYESLTEEDRALGHKLLARWLDGKGVVDPATLAAHYEKGGARASAASLYLRAARRALDGDDHRQCLAHCDSAERCDDGAQRGAIALARAEAHRWLFDHSAFERSAREAIAAFEPGSEAWCEGAALRCIALARLDRTREITESVAGLVSVARESKSDNRLLLLSHLVIQLCGCGEIPLARLPQRELEAIVGDATVDDLHLRGHIAAARGTWAHYQGDVEASIRHASEAIAALDLAKDHRGAALQRSNLGFALMDIGDLTSAERTLCEGIQQCRARSMPQVLAFSELNLGLLLAWTDRSEEGLAFVSDALRLVRAQQFSRMIGVASLYKALILLELSRDREALPFAREATERLEHAGVPYALALATLAHTLARLGEASQARQSAAKARSACETNPTINVGVTCAWRNVAEAFARLGDAGAARQAIARARATLVERAAKVRSPDARARLLSEIPDSRAVLAWGGAER